MNVSSSADAVAPKQRPLAVRQAVPWLLFIIAIAVAAWLAFKAFGPKPGGGDPIATTIVAFQKQNRLTVFSAEMAPVVSAEDSRVLGLVKSRQVAVIPARVEYALDLSKVDRSRLAWNTATKTLSVLLPALEVGRPNLDEGRAQYMREGVWITRSAQDSLSRTNTRLAEQQATQQAANPQLMALARSAAKDAIRQNLAIPLEIAGFGRVTVDARFEGEGAPASK